LLEKQVREFSPELVCVFDKKKAVKFKQTISDTSTKVVSGMDGLIEAATYGESEIVITAFVGMIGIRPTIEAIKAGKNIALANKETLVTAGHIIIPLVQEYGVKFITGRQ
jgi:1-deoxy-D-xylulose-5-phosphate reductoisomerase